MAALVLPLHATLIEFPHVRAAFPRTVRIPEAKDEQVPHHDALGLLRLLAAAVLDHERHGIFPLGELVLESVAPGLDANLCAVDPPGVRHRGSGRAARIKPHPPHLRLQRPVNVHLVLRLLLRCAQRRHHKSRRHLVIERGPERLLPTAPAERRREHARHQGHQNRSSAHQPSHPLYLHHCSRKHTQAAGCGLITNKGVRDELGGKRGGALASQKGFSTFTPAIT